MSNRKQLRLPFRIPEQPTIIIAASIQGSFEVSSLTTTVPPGSATAAANFATLKVMLGGADMTAVQDDDYDFTDPTGAFEVSTL